MANQKLGLLEALLEIGNWEHAKKIMDRFPSFYATSQQPIAEAICVLIHQAIDPLYTNYSGLTSAVTKHRRRYKCGDKQQAQTFQELAERVFPIFSALGPHLSYDVVLLIKLVRLGKAYISNREKDAVDETDVVFRGFLTVIDEAILPSLSLLPNNCCVAEEIWGLIKMLKYQYRFRLYGQWKNETLSFHPKLIKVMADTTERAKYLMKRLSKENVKQLGRQIGKLSHSNPGILFDYVVTQIQRYDNFITPVIDSLKFLTNLSYDVLAYCIMEALANPEKERMKHDDTSISKWLISLASFCGAVCKKYQIDLAGLIQYIVNTLKAGKSFDLLILREILTKMAGIEISEEQTADQLSAMSGGELLRQEGSNFQQVRNTKRSSGRLKEALLEHNLAIPLCLLLAQHRDSIIFTKDHEDNRHLKLIGKLYDQCLDTLVQFSNFLSVQLTSDEFTKRIPTIDVLLLEYNIPPDAAFNLTRFIYINAITAKFEELRKADKKAEKSTSKTVLYVDAVNHIMNPLAERIRLFLPEKVWDDFIPIFYTTFWTLTMYDLEVPKSAYENQINQIKSQIQKIEDNRDMAPGKRKKEKERCVSLMDKLLDEEKKQQDHVTRVMARLMDEKDKWFSSRTAKNTSMFSFLQLCVFPRVCFTSTDAVFCAKFIHILHSMKTPSFQSLICYDKIFCDITYFVSSCTENEAHRYGRFLCAVLDTIMKWHADKHIFDKECGSFPGFMTVFRKAGTAANSKAEHLDYENFRHVCHKWHFAMTKAMVCCLESQNYIQIRNAIIFLTKVLPHYPKIAKFGQPLERRVDRICQEQKEKRPDLYVLALGYAGQLKTKRKTWIPEAQFHYVEPKPKTSSASSGSSKPTKTEQVNGKESVKKEPDQGKEKREKETRKEKSDGKQEIKSEKGSGDADKAKPREVESKSRPRSGEKEEKRSREKGETRSKDMEKPVKDEKESKKQHKEEKKEKNRGGKSSRSHSPEKTPKERKGDSGEKTPVSHGRRSADDPSPKHADERDVKRRKMDVHSSKENSHSHDREHNWEKSYRSPGQERTEVDYEAERSRKVDRKRSINDEDRRDGESKKHKSEESSKGKSKQNGDSSRDRHEGRPKSPKEKVDKTESHRRSKSKDVGEGKEKREKHSKKKSK